MVTDAIKLTKIECITGWRRDNHQHSHPPLEKVWSNRSAKRLCRHPELGVWQHTLSTDLTDQP